MVRAALTLSLIVLVLAQVAFANRMSGLKSEAEVVPAPPTATTLAAMSFGDSEFLYRVLALNMQEFGDSGGKRTPLKAYDMPRIVAWMDALDGLNPNSHQMIGLAMTYFSQTQARGDLRVLVDFARRHVAADPEAKWPWLANAVMLADKRLGDLPLALAVARQLAAYDFPNMMPTAFQYPAYILEKMERYEEAAQVVTESLSRGAGRFSPADRNWTDRYLAWLKIKAADRHHPGARPAAVR